MPIVGGDGKGYHGGAKVASGDKTVQVDLERDNPSVGTRVLHTTGDVFANLIMGAERTLEGIIDFGAGTAGLIGGIFDKNFQNDMKSFVSKDLTYDVMGGRQMQEGTKYSYLNNNQVGNFTENVIQGVGQMLPAVLVSVATGGLGAPAAVAEVANLATLGVGAAGNAMDDAFIDGASYEAGYGYGLLSGATEVATEKMFGGFTKGLTSAGFLDKVGRKAATTGAKRVLKQAAEEGLEEITSELVNPILRTSYKGKDALKAYESEDYWKGVAEAGAVGSMASLAYGGTVGKAAANLGMGYVGKEADIAECISANAELKTQAAKLQAKNRLTPEIERKVMEATAKNYTTVSNILTSFSTEKRVSAIKKFGLENDFNSNGTLRKETISRISGVRQYQYDTAFYSVNLRGREGYISNELQKISRNSMLSYAKARKVSDAQALKDIGNIKVASARLTEAETKNFQKFQKALNALNEKSRLNVSFVVTDSNPYFNGIMSENSTMYISRDNFANGEWANTLIHEYMHVAEGTESYEKLSKYLRDHMRQEYLSLIEERLSKSYNISTEKIKEIVKKSQAGKALTKEEYEIYNIYKSEQNAMMAELVLGNEEFINKLVANEGSIVEKIINKIHRLANAFKNAGNKEYYALIKAEKLYLKAAQNAGNTVLARKIRDFDENDNSVTEYKEESGKSTGIKFSKKISEYPYSMQTVIRDYLNSVDPVIKKMVSEYRENGKIDFQRYTIGKVSDKTVEDLKEILGQDYSGYSFAINTDNIKHIENRHGVDGQNDRTMADENDIARIPYILSNYDSIEILKNEHGERVVSSEFRDIDGKQAQQIVFRKKINGTYYCVEAVGENNYKKIWTITAYISKTKRELTRASESEITQPPATSETMDDSRSLNISISNNPEKVNTKNKYSLKSTSDKAQYFSFKGENFPEEQSAAHDSAVQWAKNEDVKDGEKTLVFYAGKWYAVVKDSDKQNKYFVEAQLRQQDYDDISEMVKKHGKIGDITSIQPKYEEENVSFYNKSDIPAPDYQAGSVKKYANLNLNKVYTKKEAREIVRKLLGDISTDEEVAVLFGRDKTEIVDALYKDLNTLDEGKRTKAALTVADEILQGAMLENVAEQATEEAFIEDSIQEATMTLGILRPYLHTLDLSSFSSEIKAHYGTDNSVYLLWSKKTGGVSPDVVAMELEDEGIHIDAVNPAEIFIRLDEMYRSAAKTLKQKAEKELRAIPDGEKKTLRQKIARDILLSYDENGDASKLAKVINAYESKLAGIKEKLKEAEEYNRATNYLLGKAKKVDELKAGTFVNAAHFDPKLFKGTIERLARIIHNGNINKSGTREIVRALSQWYVEDNMMLQGDAFNKEIAESMAVINKGSGDLSISEMRLLSNIVDYFIHFAENYNKVVRNGKLVEAVPVAEKYVKTIHDNKHVHLGKIMNFLEKPATAYLRTFADPFTVARILDKYDNGFFSATLEDFRAGAVKQGVLQMDTIRPFDDFVEKHKTYFKELKKRKIEYAGHLLNAETAFSLYLTLQREQAVYGLAYSGFEYKDEKGFQRVPGFAEGADIKLEKDMVLEMAEKEKVSIEKQLTETDKEYISVLSKILNGDCKKIKRDADMARQGYSNVLENSFYYPIKRANVAKNVDGNQAFILELESVSNASFNKDTVKGAKNELFIEPMQSVVLRHIDAVTKYSALWSAIDNYNTLFNLNLAESYNKPMTIKTESADIWTKKDATGNRHMVDEYYRKLIMDIQKIGTGVEGKKFLSFLRGSYARFQLAANPKVWVTQLSSIFAASGILDYSSIIQGFAISAKDVDKYCRLAELRNYDNTAALSQGVLDKLGKVSDVLMKPIGMMDRFVVCRLFGACKAQVAKNGGPAIGTEENKVAAGKLLEKVICETQQNSMATERSAAMRSENELLKTTTMFTADSMKVIGRVIDAFGEITVLKAKIKKASGDARIALDAKLKRAKKKAAKSTAALVMSAIFMALVAEGFRMLYAKDDDKEPEEILKNMGLDAIGNMLGGLPFIKDLYARLVDGYDLDNYAYSAINDLFNTVAEIFDVSDKIINQKQNTQDVMKLLKNMAFSIGQIFGIPMRNIYNIITGLTRRISPEAGYMFDSAFYNKSLRSDLKDAIEDGDEEMVSTIAGIILNEEFGGIKDKNVREELKFLIVSGYDVLPKKKKQTVSVDGKELVMSDKQFKEFKEKYEEYNAAISKMLKSEGYKSASQKVKAKAIKSVYEVCYNKALESTLKVELNNKMTLFSEVISIEELAIIIAKAREFEADKDRTGKTIFGSKKKKVQKYVSSLNLTAAQKYMIMGLLGYKNANGEKQVASYINRLAISKEKKKALMSYSGY